MAELEDPSLSEVLRETEALRRRERQLLAITDALPVLVAVVDLDRRYQFANAAYERWFGSAQVELVGRHVGDVIGPAAYAAVESHLDRALAGEPVTYEAELPYRGVGPRWVHASYVPQRGEDGRVTGVVVLVADISERKGFERERAAAALENARLHQENVEARSRAEQLYRFAHAAVSAENLDEVFAAGLDAIEGALGTSRTAILLFDESGVMRFRAWRNLSDEYRRSVEGHSPWPRTATAPQPVLVPDVEHDASLAAFLPLFHRERIGALAFIPLVTRGRLLGKFMVYQDRPHTYAANELEIACALANHLASITSRFAAVAELEQTIHYNELFAGVLAHDLRNPLGAMMSAAQLLLMRQEGAGAGAGAGASAGASDAKPLGRILSSGQRMSRMIDQLLDFTHARAGGGIVIQPREANLAELCSQAVAELELVYPDRTIVCDFTGDQDGIWDPDRLLQIISNLVANAGQHAAPDSGITVRLDGRRPDVVALEVHNGGAIPAWLLPTLFDPFRGTRHRRDQARGLGLGLFIVKELVRAHGGTVDVASTEAGGTTFTVRLPRRPAA
jgi:PAS domain S-box-containing protein